MEEQSIKDSLEKDYNTCSTCNYVGLVVLYAGPKKVLITLCPRCVETLFTSMRTFIREDIRNLKHSNARFDKVLKREPVPPITKVLPREDIK